MEPQNFPESNKVLVAPGSMTKEECGDLHTWTDGRESISCWKPTLKERISILLYGKVWLSVLSGYSQPPITVWGASSFAKKENWFVQSWKNIRGKIRRKTRSRAPKS